MSSVKNSASFNLDDEETKSQGSNQSSLSFNEDEFDTMKIEKNDCIKETDIEITEENVLDSIKNEINKIILDIQRFSKIKFQLFTLGFMSLSALTFTIKSSNLFYDKNLTLSQLLCSDKDIKVINALKIIIQLISKGNDATSYFANVVKNVASKNDEIRKLVYAYLARYASENKDLALLSISSFQKMLMHENQLFRGSALRVLNSISIRMIVPLMSAALIEKSRDLSPYVRKIVCNSLPSLVSMDPGQVDVAVEIIERLLGDKSSMVIGSAFYAFEIVCPDNLQMLHGQFRKICKKLLNVDEWSQVFIILIMKRYIRKFFNNPFIQNNNLPEDDVYGYENFKEDTNVDPDHMMFLVVCKSLLMSLNSSVKIAVIQMYLSCGTQSYIKMAIISLFNMLQFETGDKNVVLYYILKVIKHPFLINHSEIFMEYVKYIFVDDFDNLTLKKLKLDVMYNISNKSNVNLILPELEYYTKGHDVIFSKFAIKCIGKLAFKIDGISDLCLCILENLLSSSSGMDIIIGEAVIVIQNLIKQDPRKHKDTIKLLARMVLTIKCDEAKANILWLIGNNLRCVKKFAPDILRQCVISFMSQADIVKQQIVTLGVKLYLIYPKHTTGLCKYLMELAKYDKSFYLRDRVRTLTVLLKQTQGKDDKRNIFSENVKDILCQVVGFVKKPVIIDDAYENNFEIGTLSCFLNKRVTGYRELPEWSLAPIELGIRDVVDSSEGFNNSTTMSLENLDNVTSLECIEPIVEDKPDSVYAYTSSSVSSNTNDKSEYDTGSYVETESSQSSEDRTPTSLLENKLMTRDLKTPNSMQSIETELHTSFSNALMYDENNKLENKQSTPELLESRLESNTYETCSTSEYEEL
ncbi:AP-3 complex subunit beta [Intoshia linei]|uniref:AP-3 complex subunit beta n=1 Tax=Intoshia linei TaxID=1819745 RepID=A0A177B5R7_9BILA|nr:AP-3 complex subunit beta [Intoshia linei]